MLSFLKKIFGAKPAEPTPAPYKVDHPSQFPFPKTVTEKKKPTAKNTAAPKKSRAKKSKPQ